MYEDLAKDTSHDGDVEEYVGVSDGEYIWKAIGLAADLVHGESSWEDNSSHAEENDWWWGGGGGEV